MSVEEFWLALAQKQFEDGELEKALFSTQQSLVYEDSRGIALALKVKILELLLDAKYYFFLGNQQHYAGNPLDAVSLYEIALKYRPDFCEALVNRGNSLFKLRLYDQALISYEQAILYDPKNYSAFRNKGILLDEIGCFELAISAYKNALEIRKNSYEIWSNCGASYDRLKDYESALSCFKKALNYKEDYYEAIMNRSITLTNIGQYEEALHSLKFVLEHRSSYHLAHHALGSILCKLGCYEEAIAAYDQALMYRPDFYEAWFNRSVAVSHIRKRQSAKILLFNQFKLNCRGYFGQVKSLDSGLEYYSSDTNPRGYGYLCRALGDAHYEHHETSYKPLRYLEKARVFYEKSLTVLTIADHPEERLQTLQRLVRVHFALNTPTETLTALIRQGAELRDRILTQAKSQPQRDRLYRTLPNFNEFTVDLHLRQGETIRAIETAEADKNGLMQWLLPSNETPNYHQMRQWIAHRTVVYWHFSANALTTFILTAERDRPIVLSQPDPETALKQRNELETWIENWNKNYNTHLEGSKKKSDNTEKTRSEWQNNLETELEKLAIILDIPTLITHLTQTKPLILIPHRDLHRLPLPSFFPSHLTTTLPSIQLGRSLRTPYPITHLLNIPAPSHQDTSPLPEASLESIALGRLLTAQNIPVKTIANCTLPQLQTALPNHHTHLHFNGHAYYNDQNPKQSALALEGTDRLTVEDLASIDLHHYSLITLASCETALTGNQTITAEYVGLVSALLSHGIPHILSTLWTVESKASALLILQFYRQLLKGRSPAQSLRHSQRWLQRLTNRKLDRLYRTILYKLPNTDYDLRPVLKTERHKLSTMDPNQMPYRDPYFWAAFTLAGHH